MTIRALAFDVFGTVVDWRGSIVREAAALGPALAGVTANLHPSVQLFWFEWTAPSLWLAHRYPSPDASLEWRAEAEGLLVHRPGAEVLDTPYQYTDYRSEGTHAAREQVYEEHLATER